MQEKKCLSLLKKLSIMEGEHFSGERLNLVEVAREILLECQQMIDQLQEVEDGVEENRQPYEMDVTLARHLTECVLQRIVRVSTLLSVYTYLLDQDFDSDSDDSYDSDGSV